MSNAIRHKNMFRRSFNQPSKSRNACQLFGRQAKKGYDWWWHSLTAHNAQTGEERAFFFEFYLCNPAYKDSPEALATPIQPLGYIRPETVPSYLMVKAGCWGKNKRQLHRFYSWNEAKVDMGIPFSIETRDCTLSETESSGHIVVSDSDAVAHPEWLSDAGEIEWHLQIRKQVAFNVGYGAGPLMRKWQAFEMFWHAEGMKTQYEGEIIFEGERYIVTPEHSYGYADKNWGQDFTTPWLWLSSCSLKSELTGHKLENSVFDIGGGRPVVCGIQLPGQLLSAFWYEGKPFEFNFSKFWTLTRTHFHCYETETEMVWHVEQRNWSDRMVADIHCPKDDMLLVRYEAPDGLMRHRRLWNGGTGSGTIELYRWGKLVDRIHCNRTGCEYGDYDHIFTAYK